MPAVKQFFAHISASVRHTRAGLTALVAGLIVLAALPLSGTANLLTSTQAGTSAAAGHLLESVASVTDTVKAAVTPKPAAAPARTPAPAPAAAAVAKPAAKATARPRAEDPQVQPPLHGTNPHGQGSVASVDLTPNDTRPADGDPSGKGSGEDIVVGRARGEQAGTAPHGHITILALFGTEILGVDTAPGQTVAGPLDALQQALLNPICDGSGNQVCVTAVRADSATTATGSTNTFSTAHATIGGAAGLDVGAAESKGNITTDAQCQTSNGSSSVAGVNAGGQAVASLAQAGTDSKACTGQAPVQHNNSSVLGLGGTAVPLPAAGCGTGTADTQSGIPTLLPIICNADDANGQGAVPSGVREALSIFALATGTTSLTKIAAAGAESVAAAPAATTPTTPTTPTSPPTNGSGGESGPACSDGRDNDGDGKIDAADPGCHSDNNADNPSSFNPSDTTEGGGPQCSDGRDNDGDGKIDAADPGCHSDNNADNPASYNPNDDSEAGGGNGNAAQCADGRDNDGDNRIDSADPGCHSDGDASNRASYVPSDDSEANGGNGLAALPFTGGDVLKTAIVGLVLTALGLTILRRREDEYPRA